VPLKLLNGKSRAVVIANACDPDDYSARRSGNVQREIEDLASLGIESSELDLRDYFGKADELLAALEQYDLVWVRGGNVFVLAKAFQLSGADVVIKRLVESDKIVYGGYSAGACILAPNLHGIELVDNKDIRAEGYSIDVVWSGLGFLPYSIAPHYRSDHPESAAVDEVVEYMINNHIPFVALQDGQAIIIEDGQTRFI
jgi:dipeptidase E